MTPPPEILESLRHDLRDRAGTAALVRRFVDYAVNTRQETAADGGLGAPAIEALRAGLETLYPQAVDTVFQHAESDVEKVFLNATILLFLYADPLGLIVQPPCPDAREVMTQYREHFREMLEVDRLAGTGPGSNGSGFLSLIERLTHAGEITREQHDELERDYTYTHGLGWFHAFYLSFQPRFPDLKLDARHLRPDLLVWRLDDDKFNVIVDCDGYRYHTGDQARTVNRRRDRLLRAAGFALLSLPGADILRDPVNVSVDFFNYLQRAKKVSRGA